MMKPRSAALTSFGKLMANLAGLNVGAIPKMHTVGAIWLARLMVHF
jgi:hypothetical protein